ncbi:hypothetical protein BKA61DRAFT_728894 [Leptodontidium sp. MPI-SDFR-AT-0119]|nr:hypothetical protein BKA61DRAFT_728894 [Leptodontidium sp. MPI-SDFR-AT-0119]
MQWSPISDTTSPYVQLYPARTPWSRWIRMIQVGRESKEINYEEVPLNSGEDIEEEADVPDLDNPPPANSKSASALTAGLLCFSLAVFLVSLALRFCPFYDTFVEHSCMKQLSTYSPLLDYTKQEWIQYDVDDLPSKYQGPLTDDRKEAWDQLILYNEVHFGVPYGKLEKLNKSSPNSNFQQVSPSKDGRVIARAEMFHQLHCVSMLREYVYREPVTWPIEGENLLYRIHMDHCIFVLLANIQCMSDVTPVIFMDDPRDSEVWQPHTAPHFCRRHNLLEEWSLNNSVDEVIGNRDEVAMGSGHRRLHGTSTEQT